MITFHDLIVSSTQPLFGGTKGVHKCINFNVFLPLFLLVSLNWLNSRLPTMKRCVQQIFISGERLCRNCLEIGFSIVSITSPNGPRDPLCKKFTSFAIFTDFSTATTSNRFLLSLVQHEWLFCCPGLCNHLKRCLIKTHSDLNVGTMKIHCFHDKEISPTLASSIFIIPERTDDC